MSKSCCCLAWVWGKGGVGGWVVVCVCICNIMLCQVKICRQKGNRDRIRFSDGVSITLLYQLKTQPLNSVKAFEPLGQTIPYKCKVRYSCILVMNHCLVPLKRKDKQREGSKSVQGHDKNLADSFVSLKYP